MKKQKSTKSFSNLFHCVRGWWCTTPSKCDYNCLFLQPAHFKQFKSCFCNSWWFINANLANNVHNFLSFHCFRLLNILPLKFWPFFHSLVRMWYYFMLKIRQFLFGCNVIFQISSLLNIFLKSFLIKIGKKFWIWKCLKSLFSIYLRVETLMWHVLRFHKEVVWNVKIVKKFAQKFSKGLNWFNGYWRDFKKCKIFTNFHL